MAHFAELDENNKVIRVIVVGNLDIMENGVESEEKGIAFCKSLYGENTRWVQTSYNNNFRQVYGRAGSYYNAEEDKFYPPKPYATAVFNAKKLSWEPPVPPPDTVNPYFWDETTNSWKKA